MIRFYFIEIMQVYFTNYRVFLHICAFFACMYVSNSVISDLRAEIVNCHLLFLYLYAKAEQRQSVIIYLIFFASGNLHFKL